MASFDIAVLLIIALLAMICIRSIRKEFRKGELCECTGNCNHCRIPCRSNPNFYGDSAIPVVSADTASADTNTTQSGTFTDKKRLLRIIREDYFKLYPESQWYTFVQNLGMICMLTALLLTLAVIFISLFHHILTNVYIFSIILGMIGTELDQFADHEITKLRHDRCAQPIGRK